MAKLEIEKKNNERRKNVFAVNVDCSAKAREETRLFDIWIIIQIFTTDGFYRDKLLAICYSPT